MRSEGAWPLFDGWCASRNVEPLELPWDRFLNLVYHFAVRNASKEKKQEFDSAISQAISIDEMQTMRVTRRNALSGTQSAEQTSAVDEVITAVVPQRRSKLPPTPAGWGDAENITRQSLMVAQSLKVGAKTQQ